MYRQNVNLWTSSLSCSPCILCWRKKLEFWNETSALLKKKQKKTFLFWNNCRFTLSCKKSYREIPYRRFTQFSPMITFCITAVCYHNQETDINTILGPYSNVTNFTCTHLCVYLGLRNFVTYVICIWIPALPNTGCVILSKVSRGQFPHL